jgi:hypothetical protein
VSPIPATNRGHSVRNWFVALKDYLTHFLRTLTFGRAVTDTTIFAENLAAVQLGHLPSRSPKSKSPFPSALLWAVEKLCSWRDEKHPTNQDLWYLNKIVTALPATWKSQTFPKLIAGSANASLKESKTTR